MITAASQVAGRSAGLLDRKSIVAGANFNRWLVPPAALAIHLCIGMAYGFSVFWLPMTTLLPGAPVCTGLGTALVASSAQDHANPDWPLPYAGAAA